ncbi:MAG TPA: LysR substrate-binding domain-containing protein [Casimicrobiaceae bacterium]|nr:LysR substrate-binding domain-containing protein [Casimicrobiaceae bacterium]
MIGKAKPRDLAFGALRPRHKGVQKNFNTSVPANLVENQLDGFGIEDQKDAAMPLRRRDGAHRAELGNYVVGYAPHGLPRLLLQRIDAAIGQHATRGRCSAKAARMRSSLFERTTRKLSLTDQGRRLLPVAQRIVHDVDDAISSISGQTNELEGPLRIKVPTTLTTVFLARVLARFQQAHPNVSLDVVVIDRSVNPVQEGFDLVVGMLPATYDNVLDVGLCPLDRFVVASPKYVAVNGEPQHPADLSRHRLLNFGPTGPIWSFTGPEGQIAVTVEPHLTTNDGHMLLESALAGVGIAIVSSYMASAALARGQLVRLLDAFPIPQFRIRAQIPHSRSHLTRVQALLTCLRETFDPACAWEKNLEL